MYGILLSRLGCCPQLLLAIVRQTTKADIRIVGPSLAVSLEPLAYRRYVASLSLTIGITLVDVIHNWINWFHFLFLEGRLLVILIDCMIFLSPFLDITRMSMSTVSFLAQLDSGILCL